MDYEELGSLCICRNLFSRNRHIGWVLCAVPGETVSMGQRQLLDELGNIVEYWSGLHEDRVQLLSYTDIFQEFLSGHVNGREQGAGQRHAPGGLRHILRGGAAENVRPG